MIRKLIATAALLSGFVTAPALAFEPIVAAPDNYLAIHPNGVPAYVLATREQTGGEFSTLILTDTGPGGGPGPAIIHHWSTEIWYVLEGSYEFHIGDKAIEGGPGTFLAFDAGTPHGYISKGPGKILATFLPGGYEQFFIDWDKLGLKPGPDLGKLENQYGVTRP